MVSKRPTTRARVTALGAALLAGSLIGPGLAATPAMGDTAPPSGTPATVSADALPAWQINGVVWSQVTVGDVVYATGSFTKARPPGAAAGTSEVDRGNLLAYNITTGELLTSFRPSLNAQGRFITASPDGTRVYVTGDFTSVDGKARNRIAAFDTATGALVAGFAPSLNNSGRALAATNSTVYVGGLFTAANGVARSRLAALSATTGAVLSWAPTADAEVTAMVMAPDLSRVVVAGRFTQLSGASYYGIGSLDATSGALRPWSASFPVRNAGVNAAITSLTADATTVYGTGYVFGTGGNFEGRFAADPYTGNLTWMSDCHGDSYSAQAVGQVLYSVSHAHNCSTIGAFPEVSPREWHRAHAETTYRTGTVGRNTRSGYTNFEGQPAPTQLNWYPTVPAGNYTGQYQGAWSVTGNSRYIAIGGEFPSVNGVRQQGLARFAVRSLAPNRRGPVPASTLTPTVVSPQAGAAQVSWQATWDMDNVSLTYRLFRDGSTTPVYTVTRDSRFWSRPSLSYTDTGVPAGSHTYRVSVTDPLGNQINGAASSPVAVSS